MKLREICTLAVCVAVLSACVVPVRDRGGYHDGGRHDRGGYGHGGYGYSRGDRWRGDGYEVNDWHGHQGLYEPPHGYHWVQNGNQFLLAAVATGVIAAIVMAP